MARHTCPICVMSASSLEGIQEGLTNSLSLGDLLKGDDNICISDRFLRNFWYPLADRVEAHPASRRGI